MNLLSIGGSDPSSGAGIQADIKTFSAHHIYGLTVVTAVTSQNTSRFLDASPVSAKTLRSQMNAVLSDFEIDGIKIGMVYASQAIYVISDMLSLVGDVPVVVDPVMRATTGGILLQDSALDDYKRHILPLATAITPNLQEALAIIGDIRYEDAAAEEIALKLQSMGPDSVVVTGITSGTKTYDMVVDQNRTPHTLSGPTIHSTSHGGGCAFSAALLCALARGSDVTGAAWSAREFVASRLKEPTATGFGIGIISADVTDGDGLRADLADAIDRFAGIHGIAECIPECQTNFVYSRPSPKTSNDVLGVPGRIVMVGSSILTAGSLEYGGSKPVPTALLAVSRRFPQVRSAVNLRYAHTTISKMSTSGLNVLKYDRSLEPEGTKTGGSSILWGVSGCVQNVASAPDVVFHTGDHGKEPMTILFGETPHDVLSKVRLMLRHYYR